jgi:hypothetical protein
MKKTWLFIVLTYAVLAAEAQPKPLLLTAPETWRFEEFSLPPEFAPAVKYKGIEELRFAPGWGGKSAPDYFTLIFGVRFDDTKSVSRAELKDYLLRSPVTLNMEIKVMEDHLHQKVYLMIASPQPRTNPVWQDLFKELREFVMPDK